MIPWTDQKIEFITYIYIYYLYVIYRNEVMNKKKI